MADTKISGLASGSPAQSGDLIPIDRAGANFSLQGNDLVVLTLAPGIPASALPDGLFSVGSASQQQATASATNYYITSSKISLPATLKNGIVVGTALRWRVCFMKNAAGTGTFSVVVYRGTVGSTADTADVTQSLGSQTAANDVLFLDVMIVFTAVGASGAFFWSICAHHQLAATGFTTNPTPAFTGTVSSINTTTGSLRFGLAFACGAGGTLPTITIPFVFAQALNLD